MQQSQLCCSKKEMYRNSVLLHFFCYH